MSVNENNPSVDPEEVFDPSLMKKKKKSSKKKTVPLAFEDGSVPSPTVESATPADDDDDVLDFSSLKKKKKKSKKVPTDIVPETNGEDHSIPEQPSEESTTIPKKKKKKTKDFNAEGDNDDVQESSIPYVNYHESQSASEQDKDGDSGDEEGDLDLDLDDEIPDEETGFSFAKDENIEEAWIGTDRDYTYDEILARVFHILHAKNPALAGGRKRYTIVPPQVAREGSKKTVFANIDDICNRMRRNYDHLVSFLYAELGTSGSVDGAKRLIIKGRFQPKQIENVLRRYIIEYVTCKTCKSPETILRKENRLYFMQCESCGSSRSVSAIQGGFKAQVGSRKAAKAKAA